MCVVVVCLGDWRIEGLSVARIYVSLGFVMGKDFGSSKEPLGVSRRGKEEGHNQNPA